MTSSEIRSELSIPQNTKDTTLMKTQSITRETNEYYINCGMTKHNVDTCKKKKE